MHIEVSVHNNLTICVLNFLNFAILPTAQIFFGAMAFDDIKKSQNSAFCSTLAPIKGTPEEQIRIGGFENVWFFNFVRIDIFNFSTVRFLCNICLTPTL